FHASALRTSNRKRFAPNFQNSWLATLICKSFLFGTQFRPHETGTFNFAVIHEPLLGRRVFVLQDDCAAHRRHSDLALWVGRNCPAAGLALVARQSPARKGSA